jgi:hypothetical protein
MSRSGYTDDFGDDDPLAMGRYRAAVDSALRGKRGQVFLRQLIGALDAMPEKKLIRDDLVDDQGCVCALGAVGKACGIPLEDLDPYDAKELGFVFNIAESMAREVAEVNDQSGSTPESRWEQVRRWALSELRSPL